MTDTPPRFRTRVAGVTVALALTAGAAAAAIVAPSSASPLGDVHALQRSVIGPNLIKNSGFANGFSGWSRAKGNSGALRISTGGVWGSRQAAAMEPRRLGDAVLRDARASAPRSVEGMEYQASVWVRATGGPVRGFFGLTEWKRGEVESRAGTPFTAHSAQWSRVTFLTTAKEGGNGLQVSLTAMGIAGGHGLKLDRVRLHAVKGSVTSPSPTAEPTSEPTSSPTAEPTNTPTVTPTSSPPSSGSVVNPTGDTLFGASVYEGTRSWPQAVGESNAMYGGMEVVRVFYPGLPAAWPGRAGQVDGPVVVSFKASPVEILSGKDDAYLSNWFATAPRDRDIWWTYWHEPEDDVERGAFTAEQWRDAYRHLAGLADAAQNPRLFNTVILMCWTVNPRSGRSFDAFFPGRDVVEAMGWDCYSVPTASTAYAKPEDIYGRALTKTQELGLQFGIAETGSLLAGSDPNGVQRAQWLGSLGRWLHDQNTSFVCYFDSVVGGDFRLLDAESQHAWRDVITGIGTHHPL